MGGLIGPWGATIKTLQSARSDIKQVVDMALLQEGQFFRTKIVQGLREQAPGGKAFKPLAPATLAIRKFFGFKGTKALERNGYLLGSIAVKAVSDGVVFVGVLRTAKAVDGESLVDIAKMNEEGSKPIVIKMTPRMAAMLHYAFRDFGLAPKSPGDAPHTGIIVIKIPARPFMAPVFEKYGAPDRASKRFSARFGRLMSARNPVWQGGEYLGRKL